MPLNQPHEKWEDTPGSDDRLNSTTHLSGTTTQMNATTKWPTFMPFWNKTTKTWYKNDGTETAPIPKELVTAGAKTAVHLSTTIGDYTQPTTAIASSEEPLPSDFEDDYTTNVGWTQVGTLVTVDSATPDKVDFASVPANADHRARKALGFTLSNTLWVAEFEINISARSGTSPQTFAFWLSAGTAKPRAVQDGLGLLTHADTTSQRLALAHNDGGSMSSSDVIVISMSTTYYVRITRTSATNLKLQVYSDPARTVQVGSDVNYTIPATVTGLTTLQHSSDDGGGSAITSLTIDNTRIQNNSDSIPKQRATNATDNNVATKWKSQSQINPWIRVDMNAVMLLANVVIHLDRINTTATQIKIRTSKDGTTWTDKRLVNVVDLINNTWEFRGFNVANARYLRIEGTDATARILAINEIKVRKWSTAEQLGDYDEIHVHQDINATDPSLPAQGW